MPNQKPEWIGRRLLQEGLVRANFGNMSLRADGGFHIKRRGEFMDAAWEPVFVPFDGPVPECASTEYPVHRDIYMNSTFDAILHAHPPHAIALSLLEWELLPLDSEGRLLAPRVPVVEGEPGSVELAGSVVRGLSSSPVVIARGHGTFAAASDLLQAYILTSVVEHSSQILLMLLRRG
ncbi:MAG: class II aldolase/adducin family protein [Methanomicrobiales archaeon]|nr:class II aldolase/adducin family protein [Methanomicrobiales archaeon]